jgi:hypothetical protein
VFYITAISKEEMNLLVSKGIIKNSSRGFIDRNGNLVSYYRTVNKRYIGDKYAGIAKKLNK